jgi:uncharacterized protein involved in exopolysaccharide biosynthesis
MPQDPSQPAEQYGPSITEGIDLHAYWRIVLRRRWLVLPFFAAAVTTLATLRQTRIYDAVCTIIIDVQAPRVLDKDQLQDVMEAGTGGYWYSREYYETQYKVILSRAVAQRVVDRLHLIQNDKFMELDGDSDPAARDSQRLRIDPVKLLLENLRVEPVRESRVARIRFESSDPQLSAQVANTVAEAYIAENLAVRSTTTANASDWLGQQLGDLEAKLDQSGAALFDFKRNHDIVATSWEDRQSMVTQRLTQINEALTRVRVRRAELQARNDAVAEASKAVDAGSTALEALQPIATSSAIQALKIRYLESSAECAELRVKYLTDHPRIESCEGRLALARKGLRRLRAPSATCSVCWMKPRPPRLPSISMSGTTLS